MSQYQNFQSSKIIPFDYLVSSGSIANAASIVTTLTLQADSAFELHWIFGTSSEDADTDFMPNNFEVKISDQATGRELSNARIPQRCFCGPANGGVFRMLRPICFAPNTNLQFDWLNVSGQTATARLVLRGLKLLEQI
jgi:hypothetical protein